MIRFLAGHKYNVVDLMAFYVGGSVWHSGRPWTAIALFFAFMAASIAVEVTDKLRRQA